MNKKEFKPNVTTLNLRDDLPLDQDINVEFWKDPSREVVFDLLRIMGTTPGELDDFTADEILNLDDQYFECASLIFVDCDIKDIDFSTPDSTREAFDDKRIPWGTFHNALLLYVGKLMEEYEVLKNALRRVKSLSDSGEPSNKTESE